MLNHLMNYERSPSTFKKKFNHVQSVFSRFRTCFDHEHHEIYGVIWQCVKTNSTPVVHIKIAGIYGCSFP